uniref:Multiple epidermal growth factor-like domains protein 10 n=1 Tax=Crassostrea virginica TaxID=6565 RepID=A0A8B8BWM4_CRAVI|nr:multiple epidermal growth factor-like domains protein 10 [Crassostrea virginica]
MEMVVKMCVDICPIGLYGNACKEKCKHCQNHTYCQHTDGLCAVGCDNGYHGYLCKTTCEPGTYGYECGEKCGQCEDQSKCFHTNGLCLTGCRNGYHGDLSPKALCDVSNGWQSSFYGVLMVLVLAVIWIGFLMVYIVILRKLKRRTSNKNIQMENSNSYITHIETDDHVIVSESYIELRNFRNDQDNYESIDFI